MTDLAKLRELLEKATKGNWAVHPQFARIIPAEHIGRLIGCAADSATDFATYAQEICAMHQPDRHRPESETVANAELIAALRNEAPALLAEVEKLRAALRKCEPFISEFAGAGNHHAPECLTAIRQALGSAK